MKLTPSVLQAVTTGVSTVLKELEGDRALDRISRLAERLANRNEDEIQSKQRDQAALKKVATKIGQIAGEAASNVILGMIVEQTSAGTFGASTKASENFSTAGLSFKTSNKALQIKKENCYFHI